MNKHYYVMQGAPEVWCESETLGPFPTLQQAEAAIRKNSIEWMDGGEHEIGTWDDWCEPYMIVQRVKTLNPSITVTASVRLKNV